MGRTERITIITLGSLIGVVLLVLLWSMYALISDVRQTVSSVDGAVREIAKVQGVQETVLNQLDRVAGPVADDASATVTDTSMSIRPGRPSVSARQVWDDFDANQVRAYETYSEPRVWAVSGTVDSVQYVDSNYIYVGLDGLVRVGFRSDYEREWLDEIDKGQHLWFECEVRGPDEDGFIVCISPND